MDDKLACIGTYYIEYIIFYYTMVFPRNLAMTKVVKGCYLLRYERDEIKFDLLHALQHQIEFLTTTYHLCRILVFLLDSKGERNVIITIYNKTVRTFICVVYINDVKPLLSWTCDADAPAVALQRWHCSIYSGPSRTISVVRECEKK